MPLKSIKQANQQSKISWHTLETNNPNQTKPKQTKNQTKQKAKPNQKPNQKPN